VRDGRRFGARSVAGDVLCNTSLLCDPSSRVLKHCEVRAANFEAWGDSGAQEGGWTRCADEGERSGVSGGHIQVRCGTGARCVYGDADSGLNGDVGTFSSDPNPNSASSAKIRAE
jgi:hypothetical protein